MSTPSRLQRSYSQPLTTHWSCLQPNNSNSVQRFARAAKAADLVRVDMVEFWHRQVDCHSQLSLDQKDQNQP